MYTLEMTDTFGGETNYSWVTRINNFELPENCTNRMKLKLIREALELQGVKLKKTFDGGDFEAWDIRGACVRIMLQVNY
jgi:hypothetical protein